ncbi:GNAT family N-acetyltransferase [Paenibacillus spongiae]|uniref:GNAT family N-acetyltransferase n=1 Tax=Paenibacillus spongiae TaxID=2909671 RepID=A0ABY5SA08_9BACL|nr:GNAT family N-acetyltransferase [Paenibacillus spongiae]UVI29370.1 GNAT family N-acetyltransferase [Paenibacillus spongiae]
MSCSIRRPMIKDAEEVVSLSREIADRYHVENADDWVKACEHQDVYKRYFVAVHDQTPGIIGYACVRPDIPRQPGLGKYRLLLGVKPEWRNKGVGHKLLEAISHELHGMQAAAVRVRLAESKDIGFFTKRGFDEYERMLRLQADIAQCDVSGLSSLLDEQASKGIVISTLEAELKYAPDCFRKLYEFEQELFTIWPTIDPVVPMSYEAFRDQLNRLQDVHDGYFIAKDGAAYIGCSYVMRKDSEPYGLVQGLTGVLRRYQRRGIATALKYCTMQYARQHGFHSIETASLSHNEPMLAVQRKAGFTLMEAEVRLEKRLISSE